MSNVDPPSVESVTEELMQQPREPTLFQKFFHDPTFGVLCNLDTFHYYRAYLRGDKVLREREPFVIRFQIRNRFVSMYEKKLTFLR
jgi:hypothetical protein